VRPGHPGGMNAHLKVPCLVAGMIGGADSIDDMDLLRHGAMPALFGGIRAPSTLGSFLRSFTWGNVLQLGKVNRLLLAELARRVPLLPGKDVLAFIDIDSQQKRVYGHKKQGAGFGHTKIQGKGLLVRGAKDQSRTRGSHRLWLESMYSSHAGIGGAKRGGCHPQRRMAGIGDRDMVASNHARAPSPLLHRTGDHLRHDRPLDRRTHGRNRPALARTPAPHASPAHTRHFHHPAASAQRRQGTSPVRPGPMTGVVSAGPARCCGAGGR
jgi:hypothetical protein